jgi:hypothetical protein
MKSYLIAATALATLLAAPAFAQTTVRAGSPVNGAITADTPRYDEGGPYVRFVYSGTAGSRVEVTATSDAFDTMLTTGAALGPDCDDTCRYDDDGGEGTNSMIRTRVPEGGRLLIDVQAFDDEATGAFTLNVRQLADVRPTNRSVAVGSSYSGTLGGTSAMDENEQPFDLFTVTGRPGTRVTLRTSSDDLDTTVAIGTFADGSFTEDEWDDDSNMNMGARLHTVIPASGRLTAKVSAYGGDGSYTFSAEERRAQPPLSVAALAVGSTINGKLDETDAFDEYSEAPFDYFRISGTPGQRVVVNLGSEDIDTLLSWGELEGTTFHEFTANDDGGEGTNSQLNIVLDAEGKAVVKAAQFGEGSGGTYSIVATARTRFVPDFEEPEYIEEDISVEEVPAEGPKSY